MRRLRSSLYATTCTLALATVALPVTVWADDASDSETESDTSVAVEASTAESDGAYREMTVEAGAEYVTEGSFKFGEYTGLEDEGVYAIGNIEFYYRSPFDSANGTYWSVTGYDLGLESRDIYAEYGQQGRFSVEAFYDGIPHYFFDDALTPYRGVGSDFLTLPESWVAANNISGFDELDAANRPLEFQIQRDKFGGEFNISLSDHWYLNLGARQEEKEGVDRIWGIFGVNGGNPASVVLPEPIDWQTTRVEGGIGYKSKKLQASVVYEVSLFENQNNSLTWTNAYSSSPSGFSPWDPAAGYPEPGRMSLHPDNQAHYVTFTGAYRFSPKTRVTTQFRYIRSTQDETLLPYTINPFLTASDGGLLVPLPRNSAEAEITNVRGDVKLVSRVSERATLRLSYTYDDRDNDTPRDVFLRVPNDTADQGSIDSSLARINHPFSFREHEAEASLGYRASNWLKLQGTYTYETLERTFQDVTDTSEHKGEVRANFHPGGYTGGRVQGWVKASYASRTNDGRQTNRGFLTSNTPEHIALLLADDEDDNDFGLLFENHPELQPFHTAGRDEFAVDASFTVLPSENTSLTFYGKWADADFDDSEPLIVSTLGLREQNNLQVSVDGTFSPMARTQLFANYTYENFSRLVANQEWVGGGSPTSPVDPTRRWSQDVEDEIHTVGAGFKWRSQGGRFSFKSKYNFHMAETSWDTAAGANLQPVVPYPVVESRRHRVDAKADFKITEDLKTRLTYIFENLDTADWAYEGILQTSAGTVLSTGHQPFNYSVHVIGVSAIKKF